ncbi:MAG: hypothetical protein MJA29_07410 [Candidatus Omnitrophica bacterium]|nr:hypothetical protein [Candidatus Omnitrophota bacterium]
MAQSKTLLYRTTFGILLALSLSASAYGMRILVCDSEFETCMQDWQLEIQDCQNEQVQWNFCVEQQSSCMSACILNDFVEECLVQCDGQCGAEPDCPTINEALDACELSWCDETTGVE